MCFYLTPPVVLSDFTQVQAGISHTRITPSPQPLTRRPSRSIARAVTTYISRYRHILAVSCIMNSKHPMIYTTLPYPLIRTYITDTHSVAQVPDTDCLIP